MIGFIMMNMILSVFLIFLSTSIVLGSLLFGSKETPYLFGHKRIVVSYYEGGPQRHHKAALVYMIKYLTTEGFIENKSIDFGSLDASDADRVWDKLCELKSSYFSFKRENFISSLWLDTQRDFAKDKLLNNNSDLIIAMGIWGLIDTSNIKNKKVIASGVPNVRKICSKEICSVDSTERTIRLAYELLKFKRLGIFVDLNQDDYCDFELLLKLSKELGFSLHTCVINFSTPDLKKAFDELIICSNIFNVNVVLFTHLLGVTNTTSKEIFNKLISNKIVPIATEEYLIKYGALFGYVVIDVDAYYGTELGKALVNNVKNKPIELSIPKSSIFVNAETAKKLNFDINILNSLGVKYY